MNKRKLKYAICIASYSFLIIIQYVKKEKRIAKDRVDIYSERERGGGRNGVYFILLFKEWTKWVSEEGT